MAHISKVRLKDIKEAQRFDSEYLLVSLQTFPLDGAKLLSEISDITDGEHGAPELDSKSGIIYLSGHNIKDNVLNIEGIRTCTKRLHDKNKRSSLKKDSVLLSSVGTVGNASVVYTNIIGNTDRHVITIKNINKKFSPYYISTFLNSRIGRMQTNALSCGNVQKMLNLHSARKIRIPIFPQSFQQEIETIVKTAHHKREQSKLLYKQAEKILLEELDMVNYKPKHQLSFTTSKKKIDNARRFDSEYFHPKYDKIIKKIENYYGGWGYVRDLLDFNNKNFFPSDNELYHYIPLSKISSGGEINLEEKELGKGLPTRARRKVIGGEMILSSIEGSLTTSALITKEYEGNVVSNGFYVFRSSKLNSETLLVLFKSPAILSLLKKISKGTILSGYDIGSFKKIKLPLISLQIQQAIASKVEESHRLRAKSKVLLGQANKIVEDEMKKGAEKYELIAGGNI